MSVVVLFCTVGRTEAPVGAAGAFHAARPLGRRTVPDRVLAGRRRHTAVAHGSVYDAGPVGLVKRGRFPT